MSPLFLGKLYHRERRGLRSLILTLTWTQLGEHILMDERKLMWTVIRSFDAENANDFEESPQSSSTDKASQSGKLNTAQAGHGNLCVQFLCTSAVLCLSLLDTGVCPANNNPGVYTSLCRVSLSYRSPCKKLIVLHKLVKS